MRQVGDFFVEDFFDNTGGLNLADSPFRVTDKQSTGGYNSEYILTGGFKKRFGHTLINSAANSQLRSLGFGIHATSANVKTPIRAAGTKLQYFDIVTPAFTNLTEDTAAAASDFLSNVSTQPVVSSQFNTAGGNTLWLAGGGLASVYAATGPSKATKNGVDVPTGSIGLSASGTGSSLTNGTYWYAAVLHKASTGATGNAALDASVTVTAGQNVTVNLASLVNPDSTKYDKIYIYRSAVAGVTNFTAGDLIAQVNAGTISYSDTGTYIATSQNVPRAGNIVLDQSMLPAGTYNCITTWKRRLVTASGSTLQISDVNKPESWPLTNPIVIPSGGDIKSLSIISLTTATSATIDELLVIQKENELWVLTGSTYADWTLKFISNHGVAGQAAVVPANGYLTWLNYKGIYMWDGTGKPIRCSRPIQNLFDKDGDLDKTKLGYAWGAFFEKTQSVCWTLSSIVYGEQQYMLKLDMKLTSPYLTAGGAGQREIDGVFLQDVLTFPLYAGCVGLLSNDETFLAGDGSGFGYKLFDGDSDAGVGVNWQYESRYSDLGMPGVTKRIKQVIAWVEDSTDGTLTLDWFTKYNSTDGNKSTMAQTISRQVTESEWDLAYWDSAYWDITYHAYTPVVFNLTSQVNGGTEGDVFKARFSNSALNTPVTVAGFSVVFSASGMRK